MIYFFKEKQTLIPLVWWLENFQEEGRPTPLAKSVKKNIFLIHKTIFLGACSAHARLRVRARLSRLCIRKIQHTLTDSTRKCVLV